MAGKITNLRYQKRTMERVNVYLDGKFAFGLPAIDAARLHIGQFLSDADIAALQAQDARQKAYDRALRFLSYRPRSRQEVQRRLTEAGLDEALVEATLLKLERQGYLDDAAFAQFWVENRERFQPRGGRALRQELRQKGVDDETIGDALADLDQVDSAAKAAGPRALRLAPLLRADPVAFRRKLGEFLLRRGFDYEVVKEVVRQLERELQAGDLSDAG